MVNCYRCNQNEQTKLYYLPYCDPCIKDCKSQGLFKDWSPDDRLNRVQEELRETRDNSFMDERAKFALPISQSELQPVLVQADVCGESDCHARGLLFPID